MLFRIVRTIVDHPREVTIKTVWTTDGATFTVLVHPDDIHTFVGKGHCARSIRTVVRGWEMKSQRRFDVFIGDENRGKGGSAAWNSNLRLEEADDKFLPSLANSVSTLSNLYEHFFQD